jgi:hypothetical protein
MPSLPKFVQSRLQHEAPGATDSHPDADLLTAFAERSVSGHEQDRLVEHLARCGDCREVVALAFPVEVESPARAIRTNWFSSPILRPSLPRWAMVAAGVLVIASLGTVQYRREHARSLVFNASREQEIAAVVPSTSTPEAQLSSPEQTGVSIAKSSRSVVRRNSTASRVLSGREKKSLPANAPSSLAQSAQNVSTEEAAADQPSAGPSSAQPSSTGPASADPSTDTLVDQWDVVDKAKPAFPQASSDLVPPPSLRADPSLLQDHIAPRWAIANGALQRSLDGGKSWLNVEMVVNDLPAKSGPEASIIFHTVSVSHGAEVWAGGSGGALYHTVDGGNRWSRVLPSTNGAALTGDIVGLQFTDAQNGTVTTSNAEDWITADDGQTWRKQK